MTRTPHTRTRFQPRAIAGLVVTAAVLCFSGEARSQTPLYRVTPLKDLGATYLVVVDGTIGINNKGQVVYRYTSGGVKHAWLWMPEAELGFSANTVYTIDSTGNNSMARDINENGKIGGYAGSGPAARVWTMVNPASFSTQTLTTTPSEAHALSNDSPNPNVVGWRRLTSTCGINTLREQGFFWTEGGSVTTLAPVGTFVNQFSGAFDIRRNGTDIIVGLSEPCGRINACQGAFEGTAWNAAGTGALMVVGDIRLGADARESRPYGVNDAGNVVGWVWFDPDDVAIECFPTAAFWESTSHTDPVDLSEFLANQFDISLAYAINSAANPEAVGRNDNTGHAIRWVYDSANGWSSIDLDDSGAGVIAECSDNAWEIYEAHDINDNGWIVAFGLPAQGHPHVLLLTPVHCPMDVKVDGIIDEDDAVEVLSMLVGPSQACPTATICRWDVDFDCLITEDDYDAVLAFIATCESSPCQCEGESFAPGEGLSLERFTAAIAEYESQLTEEQIAFGWERFMVHYSN